MCLAISILHNAELFRKCLILNLISALSVSWYVAADEALWNVPHTTTGLIGKDDEEQEYIS